MTVDPTGAFLEYHEPDIISILTLISFFLALAVSEWVSNKIFRAGLIGQIIVGLIYGVPIANILALEWQDAFLALGYIGLILIIFEGGLTIRLDLLRQNLVLSIIAALLGVLTPISLSFALLYRGFGHAALEAFIVGVALCSTSLGTTFIVVNSASASRGIEFSQTRVGTVLLSAAVIDDVCGLVLVSVVRDLRNVASETGGRSGSADNLGWIVGRPILASGLIAVLTPVLAHYIFRLLFRRTSVQRCLARRRHTSNLVLMVLVLCAFLAIAAYSGASILYGAFMAGIFLSMLSGPDRPRPTTMVDLGNTGEGAHEGPSPVFIDTFKNYLAGVQTYVFQPLFFASIGFAIPFLELWTGEAIWKGIVLTVLMVCGKLIVGLCIPLWDFAILAGRIQSTSMSQEPTSSKDAFISSWAPATFLGTAMIARGEIGLLIIQVGLNETPYLGRKAFVIAVWAIVLNTVIGPVSVGFVIKMVGSQIATNPRWGTQPLQGSKKDRTEQAIECVHNPGDQTPRQPAERHVPVVLLRGRDVQHPGVPTSNR